MLQQFIINKTLYNLLFLEQLQHKSGASCSKWESLVKREPLMVIAN